MSAYAAEFADTDEPIADDVEGEARTDVPDTSLDGQVPVDLSESDPSVELSEADEGEEAQAVDLGEADRGADLPDADQEAPAMDLAELVPQPGNEVEAGDLPVEDSVNPVEPVDTAETEFAAEAPEQDSSENAAAEFEDPMSTAGGVDIESPGETSALEIPEDPEVPADAETPVDVVLPTEPEISSRDLELPSDAADTAGGESPESRYDAVQPVDSADPADAVKLTNSPENEALTDALADRGLTLEAVDRFDFADNPILDYRASGQPEDIAYAVTAWNDQIAPGLATGATREDFAEYDRKYGLEGQQRLAGVYDYMLGDPIWGEERADGTIDPGGGRHRLEQAALNGVKYVPFRSQGSHG